MEIWMGRDGLDKSKQDPFPAEIECVHCQGKAEVAFVAYEEPQEPGDPTATLAEMRPSIDGDLWVHDLCAFAVYLCTKCLKPTALFNQA